MYVFNFSLRLLVVSLVCSFTSNVLALNPTFDACNCQPKFLSLRDAICLAVRNNPEIRSASLQRVVDRFALEVARNQFFPQPVLEASATYSNGTKPFYDANPHVNLLSPLGTNIEVGLDDQVNNDHRQTVGKVAVTQPLLRGFGPSVTLARFRNAKDAELINRLNFKSVLMTTINSVIQAYYRLTQDYNALEIDKVSLREAVKLLEMTQERIKAGKVAPTEIVQQQAQIANLQLAVTRDQNILSQDYRDLLIRLGLDPCSNLEIDKRIVIQIVRLPSVSQAICTALHNNPDYQKSLITLRQLERDLVLARNDQLWKLDVTGRATQTIQNKERFANVNLADIDNIGNDLPHNDRTVIFNLSIPIHDLERKQRLVKAQIAIKQFNITLETQRRQLISAVMNNLQNLETQTQQINLAKQAVNLSQQSLHIAQKKFQYGRTTMFELTSLQRNLILQQLTLVNQQIAYLNALAEFEKLLGISLEKWGIIFRC